MGHLADLLKDHADVFMLPKTRAQRWVMNDRQWRQVRRILPREFLEAAEEIRRMGLEFFGAA
eukprot:161252-Alexandrium_andersonii.AAC.1